MPTVSYNGQSFLLDGRKLWILAASLQYARIVPESWSERIAAARQAGFNTIETACPWFLHEPRKGRYVFEGGGDVRHFLELCAAAGMRVILRAGPFIGSGFDGGGLPAWLTEHEGMVLREANEPFVERVSRYFRKLFGEVAEFMSTRGGPILLVQIEHEWTSANDLQAERYLREMARVARECGVAVPLINANNLWVDAVGTIDTWRGEDRLLGNLRQLHTVQPDAPRIVSAFETPALTAWGHSADGTPARTMLRRIAEILAAGAQPVVTPFHGGTSFEFSGGRLPGPEGGTLTTSAAARPPLGEAGARGETYHQVRRLITFADHFGHVFADLDPDYHPVAIDPDEVGLAEGDGRRRAGGRSGPALSLVPLRGQAGRVIFVFSNATVRSTQLLLDSGVCLPVDLGDQPVGWYVIDVDILGQGRLDYVNLCPLAIVDRAMVVLHGPARAPAVLSVNGSPLEATVPTGPKPLVVEHKGLTFVICNQEQIDATYHDEARVYVGVAGLDPEGRPRPAEGWSKAWTVTRDDGARPLVFDAEVVAANGGGRTRSSGRRSTLRTGGWGGVVADDYASGGSPRFATLAGPQTLPACGAPVGYGWYRMGIDVRTARKRRIHAPLAGHRLHVYIDGRLVRVVGQGPGAESGPVEVSLPKGEHQLVVLADNCGRYAGGNDFGGPVGLYGHLHDVKPLAGVKPKPVTAETVDAFAVRGFVLGAQASRRSDEAQLAWSFTYQRKAPLVLDVDGVAVRGTFVLNDEPIAYYAGATGGSQMRLLLSTADRLRRGRNVIRFAPDVGQPGAVNAMAAGAKIYESVEVITADADWGFAKWEPPTAASFVPTPAASTPKRSGIPTWWRTTFRDAAARRHALWLDTTGLSKGQAYVNGRNLGRYFTATSTARAVGPQVRLYVPDAWLAEDGDNEVILFDEHGFAPHRVKMVERETGDLD